MPLHYWVRRFACGGREDIYFVYLHEEEENGGLCGARARRSVSAVCLYFTWWWKISCPWCKHLPLNLVLLGSVDFAAQQTLWHISCNGESSSRVTNSAPRKVWHEQGYLSPSERLLCFGLRFRSLPSLRCAVICQPSATIQISMFVVFALE